eukprot:TRINITY_DN18723_c0_g1_i1.p1 TRINITY_DN18723_c0_g1~~TRINITY_DN18723_c0_g1_i1.p1  ORF type:complete len:389 (+),score=139.65 TRINITY_DN18723_c0_g1_i1:78-1244(+)
MSGDDKKRQAEALKLEGNALFARKDYARAAAVYSKAISLDPANAPLYSNRSGCYVHTKEYDRAVADAKLLTKLNPTFVKGWGRLGTALFSAGQYEEAAPAFMKGFELDPTQTGYKTQADECRRRCARGEGVAGAEQRKSFYLQKHRNQALEDFKKGSYTSAIRYFTQALEHAPEDHLLYSNRSASYAKLAASATTDLRDAPEMYESALKDAEKCTALMPKWAKGFARKGNAYQGMRKYKEAKQAFEEGLSHDAEDQYCKDGLKLVDAVLAELEEEKAQQVAQQEKNKAHREEAAANPEACAMPDLKIPSLFCYKCGQEGHFSANCTVKVVQGVQGGGHAHYYETCRYCGEIGHNRSTCPVRLGKEQMKKYNRANRDDDWGPDRKRQRQ